MTQTSVMLHSATGWKAIAKMIDVSVRTAKTYYTKLDLPVKHNRAGKPVLLSEDYSEWINTNTKYKYKMKIQIQNTNTK